MNRLNPAVIPAEAGIHPPSPDGAPAMNRLYAIMLATLPSFPRKHAPHHDTGRESKPPRPTEPQP